MKTQMKFQKIMCIVMVLMGALSAVYCFMYCTGALANIGVSVEKSLGAPKYKEGFEGPGQLYMDVQPFNQTLLILSIVMIVVAALLYVTATNKRRNYYVDNYVATGLVCATDIGIAIYIMVQNGGFLSRFNALMADPAVIAKYQELATLDKTMEFVTSNWTFVLGFVIYIIVILACVALILNLVWKVMLMRGEKKLLNGNAVNEVA